jgi:hypothetical protein
MCFVTEHNCVCCVVGLIAMMCEPGRCHHQGLGVERSAIKLFFSALVRVAMTDCIWVHSSVVRAADCRSAGPWFKSGCALDTAPSLLAMLKCGNFKL